MPTPSKRYLLRKPPLQKVITPSVKRKTVDVTGAGIVLDWELLSEVVFVGANSSGTITSIGGNKTITSINQGNAIKGVFSFTISAISILTMPANFFMTLGLLDWDNITKQLTLYPGKYLLNMVNDSATFQLTLDGPQ
jgi:hypothetical protein